MLWGMGVREDIFDLMLVLQNFSINHCGVYSLGCVYRVPFMVCVF